jgi:hypothetical protein
MSMPFKNLSWQATRKRRDARRCTFEVARKQNDRIVGVDCRSTTHARKREFAVNPAAAPRFDNDANAIAAERWSDLMPRM